MYYVPNYPEPPPMPPGQFATDEEKATYEERRAAYFVRVAERRRAEAYEYHVAMILAGAFAVFAVAVLFGGMAIVFGFEPTLIGTAVLLAAGYATHLSAKRAADRAVPPIK